MGFQGVLASRTYAEIYEAPWGNGWDNATSIEVPGFGVVLGMGQVGTIPWRKIGARTPNMVRSLLPPGHIPAL